MKNNKYAFTLVELIVVITILAILGTIAFISFQGYSSNARDSIRISDINNVQKGLALFQVKSGAYPKPDDSISITASGTLIGYQGYVGDNVSRIINLSELFLDPLDSTRYIYSTDIDGTKYQLLGYLENGDTLSLYNNTFINSTYAATDYSKRYIKVVGDSLGILLESGSLDPVSNDVDIALTSTGYITYFDNTDTITASGNTLFSNIYNRRNDLIKNKEIAKLDDNLVGYWDMETLTGTLLKDWSKYGNNGSLLTGVTISQKGLYFPGENFEPLSGRYLKFDSNVLGITGKFDIDGLTISASLEHYMDADYFNFITGTNTNQYKKSIIKSHINNLGAWGMMLYIEKGKLGFLTRVKDGGVLVDYLSNIEIEKDKNYNIICSMNYKDKEVSFYVNGNKVDSHVFNELEQNYYHLDSMILSTDNLGYSSSYSRFKGTMNNLRIYNRALSDSEISALYNTTK